MCQPGRRYFIRVGREEGKRLPPGIDLFYFNQVQSTVGSIDLSDINLSIGVIDAIFQ